MRTPELGRGWGIQTAWLAVVLTLGLTFLGSCGADESVIAPAGKEIFIVVFEHMPIVTYNGQISGLRGTAKYFSQRWRKAHKRYCSLIDLRASFRVYGVITTVTIPFSRII